jgi:hypothetical protein
MSTPKTVVILSGSRATATLRSSFGIRIWFAHQAYAGPDLIEPSWGQRAEARTDELPVNGCDLRHVHNRRAR